MAVTVSRVSVVDRMVSKEYVQTAHPYDRDLASLGAWIETGFSSRGPLAGDSNCFAGAVPGTGVSTGQRGAQKKFVASPVWELAL